MAKRSKKRKKNNSGGAFGNSKSRKTGSSPQNIADSRRDTERFMAIVQEDMANREFASDAEAQAYLNEKFLSRPIDEVLAEHHGSQPIDRVEDILRAALATGNRAKARQMVKHALEIEPDCFEAKIILAHTYVEPKNITELTKALAEEEENLQETIQEARENDLGLWGFHRCRPWMNAKSQLAEILNDLDQPRAAIQIYEQLLELNPDDNQGNRYHLLVNYLDLKDHEKTESLLRQFENDPGCDWLYGKACFEFSKACDALAESGWEPDISEESDSEDLFEGIDPERLKPAREALEKAVTRYPWSLLFLTDERILSFDFPDMYQFGSPEEAMAHASYSYRLWMTIPILGYWLFTEGLEFVRKNKSARKPLLKHASSFYEYLEMLDQIDRQIPSGRSDEPEWYAGIPSIIQEELIDLSGLRGKWKKRRANAA